MESSNTQVGIMKPVLARAGIPLAITIAGFAFARIVTRKFHVSSALFPRPENRANSQETGSSDVVYGDEGSDQGLDSDCCNRSSTESAVVHKSFELQEEILRLRNGIKDIKDRELRVETRFLNYQELKNRETELMELQNKFLLEMEKVELWEREILMLEAEHQRFENMVVEYVKVLGVLQISRSRNVKLHKRIKKLLGKNKQHFHILRKQYLQIEVKEAEISKNQKEMKVKDDYIRKMENQIREMKLFTEQSHEEKNELLNKLRAAENSAKENGEMVTVEKYNQLRCELEQLQKEKDAEVQESIYLRWCNACLKHELMQRNQEQMEENKQMDTDIGGVIETEEFGSDNESNISTNVERDDSRLGFPSCGLAQVRVHSKRQRLIAKFKRWVEGTEKSIQNLDEKEKHGINCFPRHSISDGVEEMYLP